MGGAVFSSLLLSSSLFFPSPQHPPSYRLPSHFFPRCIGLCSNSSVSIIPLLGVLFFSSISSCCFWVLFFQLDFGGFFLVWFLQSSVHFLFFDGFFFFFCLILKLLLILCLFVSSSDLSDFETSVNFMPILRTFRLLILILSLGFKPHEIMFIYLFHSFPSRFIA